LRVENYIKLYCKRFLNYCRFLKKEVFRIFKLSTLNSQLSTLAFMFVLSSAYALDPMYEYRYTLGAEILVPDAFHAGIGAFTHRNADITIVPNVQLGLSDKFEIGMKFLGGVNQLPNKKWDVDPFLDVGAKYAVKPHLALQVDVPVALNEDWEWGGVLSLTQWDGYTKSLSFLFEGRVGFGGAAGENSYAKPSLAFFPCFQIRDSFRIFVGTLGSFSFGSFKDDFMVDILPKVEIGLTWFRLVSEAAIGVLTWDAERHNRYALYIVTDL